MDPSHKPGVITKPSSEFQDAPKQREASLPLTFYSSGSPTPPHPMLVSTLELDTSLDSHSPVTLWGMRARLGWEGLTEQVAFESDK